ncbi:Ig-like and fibronectin type-III domain-containing protein 2 [Dermacentor variabilis]|uniref:Ig-like and fibronectin type-III domain-containing protein 2 n=1 Tax=Dermacentor variabilis TaxID=34621 RepID=UPI003F5B065A
MQVCVPRLLVALVFATPLSAAGPSLQDTPLEPVLAVKGDEALIDCVVKDQANYTVLWRRVSDRDKGAVLTAGNVRVIGDPRISVLHNPEHNNWVLRISNVQPLDSGRYSCELNTSPNQRITRLLTVLEDARRSTPFLLTHNYTDCCNERGIPPECFGYCTLQGIVTGRHHSPRTCLEYIGILTQCLTDGRNHMPCCVAQNIPQICRSVCVGDYTLTTVTEHYTCMDYTMTTLACIANGVELLPGPPRQLEVEPVSPTELLIRWMPPHQEIEVAHFLINITELQSFDPDEVTPKNEASLFYCTDKDSTVGSTQAFSIKVDGNQTMFNLRNLKPVTMYEVTVTSENMHGTSLPTYAVRTLTLGAEPSFDLPTPENITTNETLPSIPDVRGCCVKRGVKQERCLRTMCDPSRADETTLTDVMICAPWANVTFACMADGVDHTGCCRRRGLPEACLGFCKGSVMRVDYRHFRCLEYMPFYGSCLLEHYGVLPGPPKELTVTAISRNWAVLTWKPPSKLPDTVTKYGLFWRRLGDEFEPYFAVPNVKPPYLMDRLEPSSDYEIFIVAENKYGTSEGSDRIVLRTQDPVPEPADEPSGYNETACCVNAKVKDICMPLCSYKMKLADLQYLSPLCLDEMHTLLRCGAGGRDHRPCCQRYGVRDECLPICAGEVSLSKYDVTALVCSRDIGAVLKCMEEGKDIIPGPPEDFHVTFVTPTSVHLVWNAPSGNVTTTQYQIRYEAINGTVPPHPAEYTQEVNVTTTMAIVDKLTPKTSYSFYVVAANEQGFSVPSLIILLTTPEKGVDEKGIQSMVSPPYGVEVLHAAVDAIALKWLPPLHLPLQSNLSYIVRFAPVNVSNDDNRWTSVATPYTSVIIGNLTFNTQYAISIMAMSGGKASLPSETVLAWTDAAIPAFVNLPLVIPSGPIMEGINMTVMCIGVGVPTPTVSVYVNGILQIQLPQHHVAITVPRVSRNVTKVSCFATNGYGHGAHSSVDIHVISSPLVMVPLKKAYAEMGANARLLCEVSGHPEPRFLWYRDSQLRSPLGRNDHIDLRSSPDPLKPHNYQSYLIIKGVTAEDAGAYFCSAENQHGSMAGTVTLGVMPRSARNTTNCCASLGVSAPCMTACAFDIDINFAVNRPQCIRELDKLMHCAADGSDHRQCCRSKGVPSSCLRWCVGRPVFQTTQCALAAAKEIVSCFEEGKAMLPGPPQNVRATQVAPGAVDIFWDPPLKNPDVVQWYRVLWRSVGSQSINRNETLKPPFQFRDMEKGLIYEFLVKAGNHYGMSASTLPVVIHPPALPGQGLSLGGKIAIILVMTALVLVIAAVLGIFYWKRWKAKTRPPGVSFENPTYLKDGVVLQNTSGEGTAKPGETTVENGGHRNGRPRAVENCYEDIRAVRLSS